MSNKLEQVAVRLEPEFREKLQQLADADQRSLAGLIRHLLAGAVNAAAASAGAPR